MKAFNKKFYNEESNLTSRNPQLLNDFLRTHNVSVAGSEFVKPILEFKDADLPSNDFTDIFLLQSVMLCLSQFQKKFPQIL